MSTIGANGGIIGHKIGTKLPARGRRSSLKQAVKLQQVAFDASLILSDDVQKEESRMVRTKIAGAIANLVRAWDCALDRKRVLQGKPSPGSLRPEQTNPKRKTKLNLAPPEPPAEA